MENRSANITRRTVVKTAAWSVPVVALAAATPARAASGVPTVTILFSPNPTTSISGPPYSQATSAVTLANTGDVPVVEPVQLTYSNEGSFRFSSFLGAPGWFPVLVDGEFSMQYTGGIQPGESVTNPVVNFSSTSPQPTVTTITCVVAAGAEAVPAMITVYPL